MKFLLSLSLKVKIIIAACAVAAAAAVGTVIVLNSEETYRVVKIFELNGKATVTRENSGELDAYEGMNLESGDVLSVEESSTLRVSLDSDKYILLDGGTVLELIAQGTEADSKTVINLRNGTILNEIKNSLSANSSYEVNTPKATMAVRGTTFTVTTVVNPDGSYTTTLYTNEGNVAVRLLDENGEPKGDEVYVPAGGAVTIQTDVNIETGNPAGVDGDSYFVLPNEDGSFAACGDNDPVYYLNDKASAEEETENTVTTAPPDTEKTETSSTASETEPAVTTVPAYEAVLPVSDIPTLTTVPPESSEPEPVIPSESDKSAETSATAVTSASKPQKIKNETTTVTTSVTTTATTTTTTTVTAITTTAAAVTEETRPSYTSTPPVYYPPSTMPVVTTVPPVTELPITTEPTTLPTEESSGTEAITSEKSDVHKVSFIDGNGNIISSSEFGDSETVGTLPAIAEKRGYTGKWMCGGTEITENTVVSSDMNITAVYTPRPVTVQILAPHSGDPLNTYDVVLSFTVSYDAKLTNNASGYNIARLTEYVENLYADYFAEHGKSAELKSITFSGDGVSVTDSSVITGNGVYESGEGLYISISFNYERI